jgi:hypothetical protein
MLGGLVNYRTDGGHKLIGRDGLVVHNQGREGRLAIGRYQILDSSRGNPQLILDARPLGSMLRRHIDLAVRLERFWS